VVSPDICLPLEQIDRIEPDPSLKKLAILGLIDQTLVDLKSTQKASAPFTKN
jgi:hypothetical protein